MATSTLRKIPVSPAEQPHEAFNRVQTHITTTLNPIISNPFINGHVLQQTLTIPATSSITVSHGLNPNKYEGWIIIRPTTDNTGRVYEQTSPDPTTFITLHNPSSTTVSFNLYVF